MRKNCMEHLNPHKQQDLFPETQSRSRPYQHKEQRAPKKEALQKAKAELTSITEKINHLENRADQNYFKGSEEQIRALSSRKEELEKIVAGMKVRMDNEK